MRKSDQVVGYWQGNIKDVVQAACKHGRSTTSAFYKRISIPARDDRCRFRQECGERSKDQVVFMYGDQCLVVGLHLVRAAVIVDDVQLHLPAQQSTSFVDVSGPKLIALLERHTICGEVSRERERDADFDRGRVDRCRCGGARG